MHFKDCILQAFIGLLASIEITFLVPDLRVQLSSDEI